MLHNYSFHRTSLGALVSCIESKSQTKTILIFLNIRWFLMAVPWVRPKIKTYTYYTSWSFVSLKKTLSKALLTSIRSLNWHGGRRRHRNRLWRNHKRVKGHTDSGPGVAFSFRGHGLLHQFASYAVAARDKFEFLCNGLITFLDV